MTASRLTVVIQGAYQKPRTGHSELRRSPLASAFLLAVARSTAITQESRKGMPDGVLLGDKRTNVQAGRWRRAKRPTPAIAAHFNGIYVVMDRSHRRCL
jgi:hypothetical protein